MSKIIDREAFFSSTRELYGGTLTQHQVDEMDSALSAFENAFGEKGESASMILEESWIRDTTSDTTSDGDRNARDGDLTLSERGSQVLVDREGFHTTAYLDSVGVWTIGVGHTAACGDPIPKSGMTITSEEVFEIFDRDNDFFEEEVNRLVTVPLTQYEYDAIVSFAFNVGTGAFADSTMLKCLNAGDKAGAFEQFKQWKIPPEIIPRRRGEAACFGYNIYVARIEDEDPLLADYKSGAMGSPAA